jgi:hypothetical protein
LTKWQAARSENRDQEYDVATEVKEDTKEGTSQNFVTSLLKNSAGESALVLVAEIPLFRFAGLTSFAVEFFLTVLKYASARSRLVSRAGGSQDPARRLEKD